MAGGSVEATLELGAASLRDVKGRIGPLFRQQRMAHSAGLFLDALLGPERRKTGWMRAEAADDPGPWRQQALSGLAHNETRSWHGWHRHVSLVMLAFAMMAAVRHRANQLTPPNMKARSQQAAL